MLRQLSYSKAFEGLQSKPLQLFNDEKILYRLLYFELNFTDKVTEVVHKVKHYGAFGEDYLGYSDPTKDLRKAVKQREKAAKKAKKANKKRTGKKEDLFDPENLVKYKAEIEQRRLEKEAAQAQAADAEDDSAEEDQAAAGSDDQDNQKLRFTLDLAKDSSNSATPLRSPLRSPGRTPKEESEDWKLFQNLASGVDSLVLQKRSELEELKQVSFFQKKQAKAEEEEENEKEGARRKKKKWIDLDAAGFEDHEGTLSGEDDDELKPEDHHEDKKEGEEGQQGEDKEEEEEGEKVPAGFVEIPEDEPIDLEAEEDIFNTDFVDAVANVKLAVIPDSPVYDDDPFNTGFADEIVKKDKEEKRREASRIKFTGLSSVADVLSGKADKVDSNLVEHTVKQKRRRANRINLIAEKETDVTAREDIGTFGGTETSSGTAEQKDILGELDSADVPTGDLLSSQEPSSATLVPVATKSADADSGKSGKSALLDLAEFEEFTGQNRESSLTSNVAILAGEFAKPAEEEEDDFDAAFDALAQVAIFIKQ